MTERRALPGYPSAANASIHPRAREPVWLLDDPTCADGTAAIAIAERLGTELRRIRLDWNWRGRLAPYHRHGSLAGLSVALPLDRATPAMTLSAGRRAGAVASWLARHAGSRMIHVGAAPRTSDHIDLHVVDQDHAAHARMLHTLGLPHALSPLGLIAAANMWRDRLDHLPQPRLALLLGPAAFGAELRPSEAFRLAEALSGAVSASKGAIMASADAACGREALDAFAAGMSDCLHLIYRSDEPDADPTAGFLATADAIVVAGHAPAAALRACATTAPVYLTPCGPPSPALLRLHARLFAADQARPLTDTIEAWPRTRLDEAARVAARIEVGPPRFAVPMPEGNLLAPFPHGR